MTNMTRRGLFELLERRQVAEITDLTSDDNGDQSERVEIWLWYKDKAGAEKLLTLASFAPMPSGFSEAKVAARQRRRVAQGLLYLEWLSAWNVERGHPALEAAKEGGETQP